ncbi:MAG: nucleotidyl transferase AbiEii/AbiGii toxin family protein [Gemmatimonadota bacterium]|nr:nucleotidyl transferase AbiEii/AbiGii toxin family protein [Gemmatimonadota bacterium]
MSEFSSKFIDITTWVDSEIDPVRHRQRRATHILLAAIAKIRPPYTLYLKGGLLLGLVHNNTRMTSDIDLTATFPPSDDIDAKIRKILDRALPEVAARLGYAGTVTTVHRISKSPRPNIEELRFPSLSIKIEHISNGRQRDYIQIDISFNEPDIVSVDIIDIGDNIEIYAYSLVDVIAEKYRALLQQSSRRRKGRRQDIYDIDFLLNRFAFDDNKKDIVLEAILAKCRARDIDPDIDSIDNPEVERKAQDLWDSMKLETGSLPEFDDCFKKVRQFYKDLPWDKSVK